MKKCTLAAVSLALLLSACSEKNTMINLGSGTLSVDTTYMADVEQPQQKNVLIEEFTGVSCPPCPAGHELVKSIKKQHPERVIVIANHVFNFPQAMPVKDVSKNDFRTQDATEIAKLFGGVSFMPSAVIDRTPVNNQLLLTTTIWANAVNTQVDVQSPVNMYLSSTFDEGSKKAVVKLKLAYTKSIVDKHALSLAVVEDNIIDAQKTLSDIDTSYTHTYVLRDMITPIGGESVADSVKKDAGRIIERVFEIPINEGWRLENCKIVAFIHQNEATKMNVYQVVQTAIK